MKLADLNKAQARELRDAYNVKRKTTGGRLDKLGNPIEFRLTFEEFADIWLASGQAFNRGTRHGQYCMSRLNDIGHYEVGTLEIELSSVNARRGKLGTKHSLSTRAAMSTSRRGRPRAGAIDHDDEVGAP